MRRQRLLRRRVLRRRLSCCRRLLRHRRRPRCAASTCAAAPAAAARRYKFQMPSSNFHWALINAIWNRVSLTVVQMPGPQRRVPIQCCRFAVAPCFTSWSGAAIAGVPPTESNVGSLVHSDECRFSAVDLHAAPCFTSWAGAAITGVPPTIGNVGSPLQVAWLEHSGEIGCWPCVDGPDIASSGATGLGMRPKCRTHCLQFDDLCTELRNHHRVVRRRLPGW